MSRFVAWTRSRGGGPEQERIEDEPEPSSRTPRFADKAKSEGSIPLSVVVFTGLQEGIPPEVVIKILAEGERSGILTILAGRVYDARKVSEN